MVLRNSAKDKEQVRRLLNGDLTPAEVRQLLPRIEESAELQQEIERHRRFQQLLTDSAERFDDFFATRVLARLHASAREDEWTYGLLRVFRRVAVAAVVLAGIFIAHNIVTQTNDLKTKSTVEAALAIPPATIASSIDYLDYWL
jgi:hypothetical protein